VGLKEMFPFDASKGYPGKVKVYLADIMSPHHSANELKTAAHAQIKKILENSY